jgi:hypothetical protein
VKLCGSLRAARNDRAFNPARSKASRLAIARMSAVSDLPQIDVVPAPSLAEDIHSRMLSNASKHCGEPTGLGPVNSPEKDDQDQRRWLTNA